MGGTPTGDRHAEILGAFEEVAVRACSVSEPTQLDDLLRLVGRHICRLIGVRRFSAYLRGEGGAFCGHVGDSLSGDVEVDKIKRLVTGGDAFTQEIVGTGLPVLVLDAVNDARTVRRTMRHWGVRDMLGVPLVFSGDVIGIIYVDNEEAEHTYTPDEIQVAQTFASLAALAVRQAELHTQLVHRARVIDQQRRALHLVADAHVRLTQAAANSGSVTGTVHLLGELIHKPVLFLSERFELSASAWPDDGDPGDWSPTMLCRHVQAACARVAQPERAARTLPAAPAQGLPYRQLVCPVVVDGQAAAHLVVIEVGQALRPTVETKIVEQAATVLALQITSERREIEAERQAREDLLFDLLHGQRDASLLQRRAPLLGVALDEAHAVVRVAFADDADCSPPPAARRRLFAAGLASALGTAVPLTCSVPGADLLLVALPAGNDTDGLLAVKAAAQHMIDHIGSGLEIRCAGISGSLRRLEDYPLAHRELRSLLEAVGAVAGERGKALLVGDLGVTRLLLGDVAGSSSAEFAARLLAPLLDHDTRHESTLVPTLRAFLDSGGQVRPTAAVLGVHENTVRQRLNRIAKVSTVDPDSLASLLDARFALQVLDLTS